MKKYPLEPTVFEKWIYDPEWFDRDFIHSPDGIQEWPEHHCKMTYLLSKPYIQKTRNAIDIGCRDGEYTRYLQHDFNHVYCFDMRKRNLFSCNVPKDKVTHFTCALGHTEMTYPVKEKRHPSQIYYTIDSFDFEDVDYIKIDTDGSDFDILKGATNTINKHKPVLIVEDASWDTSLPERFSWQKYALEYAIEELNYKVVEICSRNIDRVMIPKEGFDGNL